MLIGQRAQLALGLLGILVFLATGYFMKTHFPGAYAANEVIRYQYRANHIYILLASLLNAMAGFLPSPSTNPPVSRWRNQLATIGSVLIALGLVVMVVAFFVEPPHAVSKRPITLLGVVALLAGTALSLLARFRKPARLDF